MRRWLIEPWTPWLPHRLSRSLGWPNKYRRHHRWTVRAVAKLFSELDDKKFAVREQAQAALQQYGEVLMPVVEQKLRKPTSLEMRRRLEKLLEQVTPAAPGPETRRAMRTVAVLEYLGTPAARKLLAALADAHRRPG